MQYEILAEKAPADFTEEMTWGADEKLEDRVKQYIADGWRPEGGVSAVYRKGDEGGYDTVWCFQAMVKN